MDRGPRSYTVDPLGEVTAYTDAKNQTFSITYDALSRKMVRTEPDLTTTWNWGNEAASYNIGKLASVTAVSSAGTWSDAYSYDSLTRYSSETISNPGDRTYTYAKTYDLTTGLPASLQYPADTSFILTLQYGYAYGILQSVSSNSYSPAVTYWTADTMNARGQVTQETLGNGVVKASSYDAVTGWLMGVQAGAGGGSSLQNDGFSYDGDGNLLLRQDNNRGLTEDYFYDALNRLDHTTLNNVMNLQMEYDSTGMGNVASRSDVAGGATWTYDPVRKHAVTQAGSSVYTYDDNGNASSRNGYPITWTSSNLPTGISTASESVQYAYDANRQRWQEIYTGGPNGTETTYRAGKLFEVDTYGGVAHYRHFVYAGNELVSIDDVTSAAAPQYYVMSDRQGSLESIITSATSATEGCPAGYTLSGSTCTEVLSQAATATYSCPTGYTLSGTNCTDTASLAATANYSCPTGYTLSGTSCTDTLTVAATVNHSCPTGYSLSGTTCSEVLTAAATLSYSCPSGYTLSGTTCSETQSYAATIVFSCSPKPCISGTYTYTCPKGGTLSGTTCYLTVTQAATGTYSCSAGYALSGTTCSETVTQTASTSYSCPTSYNLSGTTCSDTLSENASVSYSCPTGYSLSGSTCSETATVAATVGYSCPTGYTLSGTTCGETLTVSATNSYPGIYVAESYSPYGQRRNGETWSGAPTAGDEAAINNVSRIGFTREWAIGTSMGLNHFNGRVEDSILGRFISPDSFIPDPTDTQSYNRYSYVKNNPATRVDPTGFCDSPRLQPSGGNSCGEPTNSLVNDLYSIAQNGLIQLGGANTALEAQVQFENAFLQYISAWASAAAGAAADWVSNPSNWHSISNSVISPLIASNSSSYLALSQNIGNSGLSQGTAQSQDAAADPSQNAGQSIGGAVLDFLGKVWNLPNDAIGLVFGGLGYAVGWAAYELGASWQPNAPTVGFGGNGLQFGNNPFVLNNTAITFGNVETFSGDPNADVLPGVTFANHEEQHTYQGQALGPLYLPSYIIGAVISLASGGDPFSAGNWMETGPWMSPPQPWPYPRGSN